MTMRSSLLFTTFVFVAVLGVLTACGGSPCSSNADCAASDVCYQLACTPRCQHASGEDECGAGQWCSPYDSVCEEAPSGQGY